MSVLSRHQVVQISHNHSQADMGAGLEGTPHLDEQLLVQLGSASWGDTPVSILLRILVKMRARQGNKYASTQCQVWEQLRASCPEGQDPPLRAAW